MNSLSIVCKTSKCVDLGLTSGVWVSGRRGRPSTEWVNRS